jgi:SpoVK/Ycf46/Vps4 family AAA+-type ATPase
VLGSASNRHGTETVKKAVVKFLEYVVSEDMGHGFPDGDLETGALASTVDLLVMDAKNNKEQWLDTCKCWQDDVVDQLKKMLVNQDQDQLNQDQDQLNQDQDQLEDTVHGFLEGLSLDQLQPYLDAVATVRNGEPLNLLIHAPPGCGKT